MLRAIERDRPQVRRRLRRVWALDDHERADHELRLLATELERSHPGAAASLQEGLAERVLRLRVRQPASQADEQAASS